MSVSRRLACTGLIAALTAAPSLAHAADTITLRLADSLPSGHVIHELVGKPLSELVTKMTNGQVGFQRKTTLTPGEQLTEGQKHLARMDAAAGSVRKMLEEARRQRDVRRGKGGRRLDCDWRHQGRQSPVGGQAIHHHHGNRPGAAGPRDLRFQCAAR